MRHAALGIGALQWVGWGPVFRVVTRARRPPAFASGWRRLIVHAAMGAELGHTSPQMLYRTYRELVLPEEAAALLGRLSQPRRRQKFWRSTRQLNPDYSHAKSEQRQICKK
jgi:hypothetical protein